MDYTTNYQLPVWAETDRILRTDFNDAFAAIDTALGELPGKGNCRIAALSYRGTGRTGSGETPTLTFPFQPDAIFVMGDESGFMAAYRGPGATVTITTTGLHRNIVMFNGNQVYWYCNPGGDGVAQMNADSEIYWVVALAAAGE